MLDNALIELSVERLSNAHGHEILRLVPYDAHHVPRYHDWLSSPELRELTASEPLSLDEEYEMQRTWRNDQDKLTFIILTPAGDSSSKTQESNGEVEGWMQDEVDRMIGDVNIFLSPAEDDDGNTDDDEEEDGKSGNPETDEVVGEVEVMLAESRARRKGFGKAAVLAIMWYAVRVLGPGRLRQLTAKIGADNVASLAVFTNALQFQKVKFSEYFQEHELHYLAHGMTLSQKIDQDLAAAGLRVCQIVSEHRTNATNHTDTT
ncbi:Protein canopy 3 [Savitreella phatthalungensis]